MALLTPFARKMPAKASTKEIVDTLFTEFRALLFVERIIRPEAHPAHCWRKISITLKTPITSQWALWPVENSYIEFSQRACSTGHALRHLDESPTNALFPSLYRWRHLLR